MKKIKQMKYFCGNSEFIPKKQGEYYVKNELKIKGKQHQYDNKNIGFNKELSTTLKTVRK